MKDYIELLIIPNDKFVAYINRGVVLSTLQDYQEALKAFNQALEINSKSGEAYQARGALYFKLKENKKLLKDLEKALKLFEEQKNMSSYVRTQLLMKSLHNKPIPKHSLFNHCS